MKKQPLLSLFFLVAALGALPCLVEAQDWRTITSQRQFAGEEVLRVNVQYGAGHLSILPGGSNLLYRATLRYDANVFSPLNRYENGELNIGIRDGKISGRNTRAGRLDLQLGTAVPLDLDLEFGAGKAEVELGGLRIREAVFQTGASETTIRVSKPNSENCSLAKFEVGAAKLLVDGLGNLNCADIDVDGGVGEVVLDFTGNWRTDSNVEVDMGLGSLTLRVPKGLGLSVRKSGVLASFDSQGLVKRGNTFYSENFEKADHKLNLNIDAALGVIKVQWVEPSLSSRN
jgi:hypothetical protein